ncbi:DUF1569 domain-containing protein [Paracidobacterium acidisoli]|uniref:DinB family protein n=1 Tax=Paracidobacterium acidisoli TaxID=2303751 RepID=A0A372IU20_9BACT|nr:DUF1569 domain-containing protein [Paracidobacterium acidisoli]MBT9329853.1 DUF1569 domain-containing protein [Paracidobacterium acidisoli]
MKSLAIAGDRAQLLARIAELCPADRACWGRMNAWQMVRHLTEAIRVPLGEKEVSEATGLFQRTLLKWGALWAPSPWPKGVPTMPELDQCRLGAETGDFELTRSDLLALISRLCEAGIEGRRHPYFGAMTRHEWLRWGYLHTDHHLRQFGR